MSSFKDPKIETERAVSAAGSQSALAMILGIGRSSVNEWVKTKRKFLPPLQAYRLQQIYPDIGNIPGRQEKTESD